MEHCLHADGDHAGKLWIDGALSTHWWWITGDLWTTGTLSTHWWWPCRKTLNWWGTVYTLMVTKRGALNWCSIVYTLVVTRWGILNIHICALIYNVIANTNKYAQALKYTLSHNPLRHQNVSIFFRSSSGILHQTRTYKTQMNYQIP